MKYVTRIETTGYNDYIIEANSLEEVKEKLNKESPVFWKNINSVLELIRDSSTIKKLEE